MTQGRGIKTIAAIMLAYYAAYLLSVLFKFEFWSTILSPAGAFLAALVTLYAYRQTDRSKRFWTLPVICFAFLLWTAGDILWALDILVFHKDPIFNSAAALLYDGTTLLLAVGVFIYSIGKYKRWNTLQLIIDIAFISLACLYLIWILVFDKDAGKIIRLCQADWLAAASIILDCIVLTSIAVWYLSVRSGRIPLHIALQSGFVFLFVLTDLYYYYQYIGRMYEPSTLTDAVYIAALLGIAGGYLVMLQTSANNAAKDKHEYTNIGYRHRGWLLLPAPVLVLLRRGLNLDFFVFLGIILLQEALSSSLQVVIKNKELLLLEKKMNSMLEKKIAERTNELVEKNSMLDYLSNKDTLTELYNRRHFMEKLEDSIHGLNPGSSLALLLIDIDRFKTINDLYGHNTGDMILVILSERMRSFDANKYYIARTGGDEFVVLVNSSHARADASSFAEKLIDRCTQNIQIGDYSFAITISIGVALYPKDAQNGENLVKNADIAMYQAKKSGYNKTVVFSDMIRLEVQREHEIELRLKKAVYDTEFFLNYQPFFTTEDHRLVGMEALLRWKSPKNGLIPPAEFIPIAEKLDIIIFIGNWVIEKAVCQIAEWNKKYALNLKMGINVSPKQLDQTDFLKNLKEVIHRYGVLPAWIDLEITEGIAVNADAKMAKLFKQFTNEGITISVDDFGTGYASFNSLKVFNVSRVKIAKQLIDSITSEEYEKKIVKAIASLTRSLGIATIAEGVETKEQHEVLQEVGCMQIQGYLLGRPVPPEEFEEYFLKEASQVSPEGVQQRLLEP